MVEKGESQRALGFFYFTPDCEPYYNMAFDEWLFSKIKNIKSSIPAFLRLYSWKNPGITIGYNQSVEKAVDKSSLDSDIPIIRRITGGRAIYHDPSEITFSLTMKTDILPQKSRSLSAVNSLVSETIVKILISCGIKAEWHRANAVENKSAVNGRLARACFDSVSRYEITAGGRKIAGIAQRRIGQNIIHQGSIKINGISDSPAVGQNGEQTGLIHNETKAKKLTAYDLKGTFRKEFSASTAIDFIEREIVENRLTGLTEGVLCMTQNPLSGREFV